MGKYANYTRRKALACMAALATLVAVVAVPTQAQADEWGPVVAPGVLFYTDNSTLTYCFTEGFDNFQAVGNYAMSVLDSTTDITSQFPTTPEFCEFSQTDVWWWSSNLPAGVRGRTTCQLVAPWDGTICQGHEVFMDFAELDIGSLDWEDRRKTACHELGHVVGLQHNTANATGSCLINGEIPNANLQFRRYSAHHINSHINVRY